MSATEMIEDTKYHICEDICKWREVYEIFYENEPEDVWMQHLMDDRCADCIIGRL